MTESQPHAVVSVALAMLKLQYQYELAWISDYGVADEDEADNQQIKKLCADLHKSLLYFGKRGSPLKPFLQAKEMMLRPMSDLPRFSSAIEDNLAESFYRERSRYSANREIRNRSRAMTTAVKGMVESTPGARKLFRVLTLSGIVVYPTFSNHGRTCLGNLIRLTAVVHALTSAEQAVKDAFPVFQHIEFPNPVGNCQILIRSLTRFHEEIDDKSKHVDLRCFAKLEVDVNRRTIRGEEHGPVYYSFKAGSKKWIIFLRLFEARGGVVDRDKLRSHWDRSENREGNLHAAVSALNKSLKSVGLVIENVYGAGYRMTQIPLVAANG